MDNIFTRTEYIIGKERLEQLKRSKVAIIGIGGVGSFAAEAISRAGVGNVLLVDPDTIDITNINRQIHALHSTLGKPKVEVMKSRMLDINPNSNITPLKLIYSEETSEQILTKDIDYVIDAIDSIKSKIHLIIKCKELKIPVISSMGAGNKMDPTLFRVADISDTSTCPMARVIRKELRKAGIKKGVNVVYSTETPIKPKEQQIVNNQIGLSTSKQSNISVLGSISFVPSVAGLIIAGEVIKNLLNIWPLSI